MKYLILLSILILGCQEKDLTVSIIPEEIQQHYDAFYSEGRKRGLRLRERPVEIILVDNYDVAGRASRRKQWIKIRTSVTQYGHERNAINLEYVVFHELGHYVLNRDHNNDTLQNGQLASMMYENKVAYTVNKEHLRDYYLDELFGVLED